LVSFAATDRAIMDADYLKRTVGVALAQGMAEVVARQPGDAIDYLGNFLLHYADARDAEAWAAKAAEQARREAAVQAELDVKRRAVADARESREAALQGRAKKLLASLDKVDDVDGAVLANLLDVVKARTNSRAAYLGERVSLDGVTRTTEEGEEVPAEALKYIAATKGHEFMLDEVLPAGKGVTFDALKEPAPVEEEEEDPDAELDENKKKREAPKPGLFVPNTLAEPRIHYFTYAKIGSFFAVPVKVRSYLHDNAVSEETLKTYVDHQAALVAHAEQKAAHEKALAERAAAAEARAEAAAAAAAAAGDGDDEDGEGKAAAAEEPADEELPPIEPVLEPEYERVAVDRVLCVDTLGAGLDVYDEAALDYVRAAAAALAAAIERTEKAHLLAEFQALLAARDENDGALEALGAQQQQQASELEAEVAALKGKLAEAGTSAEDQEYEVLRLQEDAARRALLEMQGRVKELERYKIAPKGGSLKALQAACYTVGVSRGDITDKASGKLDWPKMRKLLGNEFFVRLRDFDAVAVRKVHKYQTVAAIEGLLEGLTLEEINAKSVAVGSILAWNLSVMSVRKAAVEKRQREKEAEEAARAEAEAAAAAAAQAEADAAAAAAAAAAEGGGGEEEGGEGGEEGDPADF
jgi:hypothetical protein